ncbi:GIDE domain-containing protein [Methylocaldum szegediense]|uniref:RING-type E3 ubiquitin transferase n=1 Tax=Methylocaldum szegediense TaxID=73780 RepID=A0ABN8X8B9_9GAMM|nr:GIDE domain-containing protein [Methylocaldum szegediense]CAI8939445.1 RING-type E3 ubiquitin transferase [Methylocaldum szegediense]
MQLRDLVLHLPPQHFWLAIGLIVLAAASAFFLAFRWLHRARLIADTPPAKIRSAAQGYVELEGRAKLMDGEPIHAPLSGASCVWYSYKVEKRETNHEYGRRTTRWQTIESGVSEAIFHLEDDTGRCIVDPEGAEVIPSVRLRWHGRLARPGYAPPKTRFWDCFFSSGPYRYTEYRIQPNDPLYAIGQFVSLGGPERVNLHTEVGDLLNRWKRNRAELIRRFDADGDGEINAEEWETVRQQAEREVLASWRERASQTEFHLMKKPDYGRPYILSVVPQAVLTGRYRRNAWLAALGFLSAGSLAAWALQLRFGSIL